MVNEIHLHLIWVLLRRGEVGLVDLDALCLCQAVRFGLARYNEDDEVFEVTDSGLLTLASASPQEWEKILEIERDG